MSERLIVRESDLVVIDPPHPFRTWDAAALKVYLEKQGFDLSRPIEWINDREGRRWEQSV